MRRRVALHLVGRSASDIEGHKVLASIDELPEGAVPAGWVNATAGKFKVSMMDGQKVLEKAPDDTLFSRIRMFIGPTDWSNYTFEGDVRVNMKRRQMGDIGLTAQRYTLALYGNEQKLKIDKVGPGNRIAKICDLRISPACPFYRWPLDLLVVRRWPRPNAAGRHRFP